VDRYSWPTSPNGERPKTQVGRAGVGRKTPARGPNGSSTIAKAKSEALATSRRVRAWHSALRRWSTPFDLEMAPACRLEMSFFADLAALARRGWHTALAHGHTWLARKIPGPS